jgi:hypothetical protein
MKNMDTFSVRIDQLQPSQTFISQARLSNISRHVQFLSRPVPVRLIDGRLCVVEGHERCFALYSLGEKNVSVFIDDREKPSEEIFKRMVKFTEDSGVASIQDFEERILQPADFRALWLEKKKEFFDEKASIA